MALVLFFGGISCDFDIVLRYWSESALVGGGMTVVSVALFALVGWAAGFCEDASSIVFFGVVCCLSCKGLVSDFTGRNGDKTMHVKLMQGLLILQDFLTVIALTVLYAYQMSLNPAVMVPTCVGQNMSNSTSQLSSSPSHSHRRLLSEGTGTQANQTNQTAANTSDTSSGSHADSGAHESGVQTTPAPVNAQGNLGNESCVLRRLSAEEVLSQGQEMHDMCGLGWQIWTSVGLLAVVIIFFCIMAKYVNQAIIRFYLRDGELLFICAMAYSLGTCGICVIIGLSPMAGAFIAGFSLSFTTARIQIESKISSLRAFGMILFYFMVGVHVNMNAQLFNKVFGWAVLVAFLVVMVQPIFALFLGWSAGLKSRTIMHVACLHNALGEASLIISEYRLALLTHFASHDACYAATWRAPFSLSDDCAPLLLCSGERQKCWRLQR